MAKEKFVSVKINLDADVFMAVALLAHKKDITFNQMVNTILEEYIKKHEPN